MPVRPGVLRHVKKNRNRPYNRANRARAQILRLTPLKPRFSQDIPIHGCMPLRICTLWLGQRTAVHLNGAGQGVCMGTGLKIAWRTILASA